MAQGRTKHLLDIEKGIPNDSLASVLKECMYDAVVAVREDGSLEHPFHGIVYVDNDYVNCVAVIQLVGGTEKPYWVIRGGHDPWYQRDDWRFEDINELTAFLDSIGAKKTFMDIKG